MYTLTSVPQLLFSASVPHQSCLSLGLFPYILPLILQSSRTVPNECWAYSRFSRNTNRKADKKPPPIPTGSNGSSQPPASGTPNTPATGRQTMRPLMLCQPFVKASLLKGSFSTIVVLPKYVDEGEWIALNGQSSLPSLALCLFLFFS